MWLKNIALQLFAATVLLVTAGCLTSEDPFYKEGEIKTDDRLIGTYGYENEITTWQVERDSTRPGRYLITFCPDTNKTCRMQFSGVLFQIGTNRFMDMLPILQGCDHEATKLATSPLQLLQELTLKPLHLLIQVEPGTNSLRYAALDGEKLKEMAKKFPAAFSEKDDKLPRMLLGTDRQREFFVRIAGNTNLFKTAEIKRVISNP